jgi:putative tryptophan/tyrosine transport system substrate-binding protein
VRRRDFLWSAVVAVVLAPLRAGAQQRLPTVGYLDSRSSEAPTSVRGRAVFLEELEKAGFVAGRNVAIEYRFAEGRDDRLPALAAELVRLPVTVLVAPGANSAVAAKRATSTIPIVFGSGPDPVQLGLVASFSRPGGNATGMQAFSTEVGAKRLELLREVLPQPGLIAYLADPRMPGTPPQIREVEGAAQTFAQPILMLHGSSDDEVEQAFATMAERQVRGLLFGPSTYFQGIAAKLVALAARYRIPAAYEWPEFITAGGLMSYSTSTSETTRLIADYVVRILKGAAPADLPVVRSTRFELVINRKTANALGLTIPHSILQRADEVIE